MEVPKAVALVAALALVALGALATRWLQRMEARNEEVRRLALLAAAEEETIAREEAYYYGQYGGFVRSSDLPEAPSLWAAQEVPPAPKEVMAEAAAAAAATVASPTAGKGVCAMCSKPTTLRCKRCKSVKYCTLKCQIDHWRNGHKDQCHPLGHGATQDDTPENVMAGVGLKDMPSGASTTYQICDDNKDMLYSQFTGKAESVDYSKLSTSSKICKVCDGTVHENSCPAHDQHVGLEPEPEQSNKQALGTENHESLRKLPCMPAVDKVPSAQSGTYCLASNQLKREDDPPGPCARPESSGLMPHNSSTEKNYARQQTTTIAARNYPTESTVFAYKKFVELYSFNKLELHPFGLCNLGNSCYANAILQCLAFTRPLTAYLLEGYHSQNCSKTEWCFMCELEKVLIEGKQGKSPVSPTGILYHLNEIGVSFGQGEEEDAHEFMRYAIDNMQSASMEEAKKNGIQQLAEETTLVQFIFGGYLRSKIKCTKCQVISKHSERILDLTVEIDGDISTLDGALRRFTSSEILDGDNRYHCSRCNSYERAQKKLTILEAPNILTIALKRYQSGVLGKISKAVKFPEHLNLSQYMCRTDDSSPVYSLYAVVVHRNVRNATVSGHYVCYVKDSQGKWHEMDDNKVKPVSVQKVLSRCAYMLLYARCSPRAPTSARAKKPKQMARSGSFPSGGGRYRSRHQGGQLSKDDAVHNLTYTLGTSDTSSYPVAPCFSGSNSSSLFSSSDAGSSCTFSSDSTDSAGKSSMEYDRIFGTSGYMCPVVSSAVVPEGDNQSYLRQGSSWNPSSSGHDMDEAGKFARQYQGGYQAGGGAPVGGWETPSFSYADQGGLYPIWEEQMESYEAMY
ncbi:ubiquitin carboxyl-terminal hydrolase 17 isoform X1 [Zea mays]|uniref:ubiquitinyl hydrolase 1 n=3 Tax=Zea mays TaxID=4577 RepID=A0A1D6I636_MAIZE|nr:ubiquitin carboxyl-terminal hydrolase 17 isoform X1 [Zea mays]ONM55554.1 Ubiquitin carboxyl-terminal hydrolase 17 [Zea mays]|eukprot:XP_020396881.1 ubiquitin carboxyl-terminal hydrolase 17 isoform X1 [Zea mays]